MERVQKEIEKFNRERDWDQFHSPENLAKSISIEAGELLECFQWDNKFDKEEVCDELADVFNYCFQMASKLEVDPEEIGLRGNSMNSVFETAISSAVSKTEFMLFPLNPFSS